MTVLVMGLPLAQAAVTGGSYASTTTSGEIVPDQSGAIPVMAFGALSDKADTDSLASIYINFSGTGFSTTDIAALDTDSSISGVGIYRDDGDTDDTPDINDTPLLMDTIAWSSDQAQLTFVSGDELVLTAINGSYHWGIVIRTSDTVSDGDQINITLLTDNIVFSDGATMPAKDIVTDTITVDAAVPGSFGSISPSTWHTSSQTPTVTISVQDTTSGLNVSSAEYSYSTNGGTTYSAWAAASTSGIDGTTAAQTITAASVLFNQDSGTQNLIMFRINDMVQHTGTSTAYAIMVDASPPGGWGSLTPSGWYTTGQTPDVTITVQENTSGLDVNTSEYRYSTDGGTSWTAWAAGTMTATNGSTSPEIITAAAVPFGQDSATLNLIEFRITDLVGNTGTSPSNIITIDTTNPGGWQNINLNAAGWYFKSQTATITIEVQDVASGLDISSAQYDYSTDGGTNWIGWAAATVTGSSGSRAFETVTATDVPFGQDSDTLNMIRFSITDVAGFSNTSADYLVKIDTTVPDTWNGESPTGWFTANQTPDVSVNVSDAFSGLNVSTAMYRYSTDAGVSWSAWTPASVTGTEGTTVEQTITATAVPFNADSVSLNQIQFSINDVAGGTGYSGTYTIMVDTGGPSGWTNLNPAGWVTTSQTVNVTIDVSDPGYGIDTATAYYSYSTDGGTTWSAWTAASITGANGTTAVETMTATDVAFGQDSGTLNMIKFQLTDLNASTGTSPAYAIKIDMVEPGSWASISPSGWHTASQSPDVTISVQDNTSGLNTAMAEYSYSTDGGTNWSAWAAATVSGSDGTTSAETITASGVPFGQDTGTLNMIMFRITDMAGLTATSTAYTIQVDTVAPGSWASVSPSGWYTASQSPDVTISVQDSTSGLGVSTAEYSYSTDGGTTWSKWTSASVSGSDGTTSAQTVTASKVPFNQDSGTLNMIQFRVKDMAGTTGSSTTYTIQIDTGAPGSWAGISPSGWHTASQTPDVTVTVQDLGSGLSVGSAYYQYSTDGGKSWSKWIAAACSGSDGTVASQTITASKVPFNQDSKTLNLIAFKINDVLGSTGTSSSYTILIDSTVPGSWAGVQPSAWYSASQAPDVTITVQDVTSGLGVTTAYYQYSTNGGQTWSKWIAATCSGADGDTAARTITASKVPFGQDSGTLNQIKFMITDLAGLTGTSNAYTIQIDTVAPGNWANYSPTGWHSASQTPTVTVSVQDVTSGLKVGAAFYSYSTDGGTTWSVWTAATVSGTDGSTAVQTITAANVPFNLDSGSLNKIKFMIADMAMNNGTSADYIIKVDTTSPGSWAEISPAGWFSASKTPTVTVKVQDLTSGLDVSDAEYRFSTDGGVTWSAWAPAASTGADGTTSIETLTASNVAFNLDSGTLNMIEFRISDIAIVEGTSPGYVIKIDTASPADWAGLAPAGWVNTTKSPTITITVKDNTSGLSIASVQYQYSKDGGATWSAWTDGAVSGSDGTVEVQTVTAASVPFGADSLAANKIRFRIVDVAGNAGTSADYIIKVDTVAPGSWGTVVPDGWYNLSKTPTVMIDALDLTAGLGTVSASYQFSTDGGVTWSAWLTATVTGLDGATDAQTISAADVQFGQDSGSLNMIRFRISDMAGNLGTSEDFIIKIDTVSPAGWTDISPTAWVNQSRNPTVTVVGSDATSGLKTTNAQYQYTKDGGASWSGWIDAPVTGTDGTTIAQTLTATGVPFDQDSATLNKIRFRISDVAGNTGVSDDYTILIDIVAPANWTGITPAGWFNQSKTPAVTVQAVDLLSGLNVTAASYQYSTNGGATWSAWAAATVTGTAGTTAIQTITAASVPFNADSAGQNKIRFRITDLAGNTGTSADYIIKVDTTPPATAMGAVAAFSKTRTLSLPFTASDNVSGLAKLELWYSVDGAAAQKYAANLTVSPLAFEAASDGAYAFYLRGTDFAGNYENAPALPDASITVKTTMPDPVVKIKEGGDTTETSAHVSGTVEPGSKVLVNDKDVTVDATGKFSATVSLKEGSNKITVTVTDPAGNTKTVEKSVNRKAPFPTLLVIIVIVVVLAVVAGVGLMMRGRGKKGGATEQPATPKDEKQPEEATPQEDAAPSEESQS